MSKYSMEAMKDKYPDIDGSNRGAMYALAQLSVLHKALDEATAALEIERKVNTKLADVFKDIFK